MADNYDHSPEPDEPADTEGRQRPRSGMPPVTGTYIDRDMDPEASRLAASQRGSGRDYVRSIPSRRTQGFAAVALVALIALRAVIGLAGGDDGISRPSSGSSNNQNPFTNQSLPEMCAGPIAAVLESSTADSELPFAAICGDINDDGTLNGSFGSDE